MTISIKTDLSNLTADDLLASKSEIKDLYDDAYVQAHEDADWSQYESLGNKPSTINDPEFPSKISYASQRGQLNAADGEKLLAIFTQGGVNTLSALAAADYSEDLIRGLDPLTDAEESKLRVLEMKKTEYLEDDEARELARLQELEAAAIAGVAAVVNADARQATSEFQEQCFLMSHIFPLTTARKEGYYTTGQDIVKILPGMKSPDNLGYSILLDGEPFGFINKLTQNPITQDAFMNMRTDEIANLQPLIRLFKVTQQTNEDGTKSSKEIQQEMIFDSFYGASEDTYGYTDLERHLNDRSSRGQGVGIKDFSFSFEGDNPYAVKKSIKARLTLFAASFDELLRNRSGKDAEGKPTSYKYADLALKTGGDLGKAVGGSNNKDVIENVAKLNFRLIAVVGWAPPPRDTQLTNIRSTLQDAIYDSYITLNLTPIMHDFKIDDTGRVTFTIEYLAYVEDFFDNPHFNIFSDATSENIKRKLIYKILNEDCKSEEIAKMKEAEKEKISDEKTLAQRRLFIDLLAGRAVYNIDIPYSEVYKFNSLGPYHDYSSLDASAVILTSDLGKQLVEDLTTAQQTSGEENSTKTDVQDPAYIGVAGGGELTGMSFATHNQIGRAHQSTVANDHRPTRNRRTHLSLNFFFVSDLVDVILQKMQNSFKDYSKTLEEFENSPPPLVPTADDSGDLVSDSETWEAQCRFEKANANRYLAEFKKFRLVLGPLTIMNPKDPSKYQNINLGDIPVSTKYFLSWLNDQTTKKEKAHYSLPRFLNDFFNQFLRDYLNTDACFNGQSRQRLLLNQNSITSYAVPASMGEYRDEITDYIVFGAGSDTYTGRASLDDYVSEDGSPLLRLSGDKDLPGGHPLDAEARQINYLIYYAGRTQPKEELQGIRIDDENKGIFHYSIGRDRGIVKTINLQKTEAPGLAELRFEQEGYMGLTQLREVYDVKINTFSNVKAFPGVYIFVDPKGFAPSTLGYDKGFDLTKLGIGGYYMIKRSEHSFGPGYANSKIDAQWVAEIDADGTTVIKEVQEEADIRSPSKCRISTQE